MKWRGRESWAPYSMRRHMAWELWVPLVSVGCRGWPTPGRVAPPIFCGSALNAPVRQAISSGGPRIRAPSPATCAERRPFFGAHGIEIAFSREGRAGNRVIRMRRNVVSTVSSVSNVQAAPGSGFEQHYWVRPAPFARRVDFSPARPCVYPVRLQTMLTVLTQSRAFLSGNWDESYCNRLELFGGFPN